MASPYISHHQPQPAAIERPWIGMALLIAVPLLALILIRMLWSGSGLWFLTVGIILLGLAAVIFLARRPQDDGYSQATLAPEPNRLPLVLTGVGVLFLAMLLLPNFADGGDGNSSNSILQQQPGLSSEVSGAVQQPAAQPTAAVAAQNPPAQQPSTQDQTSQQPPASDPAVPVAVSGETYIVVDGDTLWDIATRFGVTVEEIIAANGLTSADEIAIGDELIIPEGSGETQTTADGSETVE